MRHHLTNSFKIYRVELDYCSLQYLHQISLYNLVVIDLVLATVEGGSEAVELESNLVDFADEKLLETVDAVALIEFEEGEQFDQKVESAPGRHRKIIHILNNSPNLPVHTVYLLRTEEWLPNKMFYYLTYAQRHLINLIVC